MEMDVFRNTAVVFTTDHIFVYSSAHSIANNGNILIAGGNDVFCVVS